MSFLTVREAHLTHPPWHLIAAHQAYKRHPAMPARVSRGRHHASFQMHGEHPFIGLSVKPARSGRAWVTDTALNRGREVAQYPGPNAAHHVCAITG